ncbi:hypothetical protein EBL_c34310 [Shimwellia blattae DSM 4481 = NBRC 105725]|uniref:Uncharacterized protein n=1 Tax=Shimwellia blattae (strain ATCC 29907 / DSM 4481 / JCM 1650 / NBRC 105725 / CDC 9005-74) TaxID=630626 RepID=I2BD87_SHIBC|nr:hypothetical protein EBL_c34310 [Shimwellia blattae DSM 4481 = NBRC 105725]
MSRHVPTMGNRGERKNLFIQYVDILFILFHVSVVTTDVIPWYCLHLAGILMFSKVQIAVLILFNFSGTG